MPADQAKISATRPRQTGNFNPSPVVENKPTSPWVPFSISFLLIAGVAGGLFYYMDSQFKDLKGIEGKLLKTNEYVLDMNTRLKKIEDSIASSDAEADQAGSSLTSKMLNLESRLSEAEKSVGWNGSRVSKLDAAVKEATNTANSLSSSVSSNSSSIASNTNKIDALSNAENPAAGISAQVQSNSQAIETMDAHRSRMSSAIQKVQSDVARLIRLYEKDNPSAKRVH